MLASLSNEAQIARQLHELSCAPTNFAGISGGILGKSRIMQALTGQKPFEPKDAERFLEILAEMRALQSEIDVPLDWSRTDAVQNALLVRRIRRIAADVEKEKENVPVSI